MATDRFVGRHIGPRPEDIQEMLSTVGVSSMEQLIEQTVPASIRLKNVPELPAPLTENEFFERIRSVAAKNKLYRSFIGQGYYDTITPAVITRNILENPAWYTSYTPYQAEVSQGRLEALLNFQTVIVELTGCEITNCSLLDEATAAAEAMQMMFALRGKEMKKAGANKLFVDNEVFVQTKDVLITRSAPFGIELVFGDYKTFEFTPDVFGALIQYPAANGEVRDYESFANKAHVNGSLVTVAADIMSLVLLTPPGEWGADIVVGSTQRFGIPMGYGGPSAAYMATKEEYKRNIPGRIIGVTVDAQGNKALRLALQSREQHIKREKASSNICTAKALDATMAGFYALYHGREGLERIAKHIHSAAVTLSEEIQKYGYTLLIDKYFDTIRFSLPKGVTVEMLRDRALENQINLYYCDCCSCSAEGCVGLSTDEKINEEEINTIIRIFAEAAGKKAENAEFIDDRTILDPQMLREDDFLSGPVFNLYRSETAMMRYMKNLERRDISLATSMISLGSCTMKLNAAVEMMPLSWPEFGGIHPFVPVSQAEGYQQMIHETEDMLAKVTGFKGCSLQPNSGAAGEYAAMMVIRKYHESRGDSHRNVVLIPASAHGTNPATSTMAGFDIRIVASTAEGNIDVEDFRKKAEEHKDNLVGAMITYPSTHGIFEESIKELVDIVHANGGQVFMDGANMNGQCGLTSPGYIGADICHLNLHKTFAMPHGGGGPGVGPICAAEHLVPFLPTHSVVKTGGDQGIHAVAASPYGSVSLIPITYGYLLMLGGEGLKAVTETAILNANYLATSFEKLGFKILYKGAKGRVGHEMIWDCAPFKDQGITELDVAKRLMDFGFHAPTLSFPVHGTLMIEPTESEPKEELDRFIEALTTIKNEIIEVGEGKADRTDNVLKNAPHTHLVITADEWNHAYPRSKAAYPLKWVAENKFWPQIGRVDDGYGDRNLVVTNDILWED
ncbi:aminomethyl-transferring glycine dehydrogenase [Porphyromonadaceae bacterium OttesenSCG-928-L07]|nr:aminomethyl-transferring glycine dehydrogenase [Porphyromonadaceae bacterium OttesenSCG-928-L07]MDL2251604.1 aminomethyl-transferring glycine dehydrogenase [Odoribacter sp. OttesenSCG-928-J03]MDL2330696.1 aminomethyl-transferring glycine dehydrogenase [Odoribacter sp. OttesenSCG-928-A06]